MLGFPDCNFEFWYFVLGTFLQNSDFPILSIPPNTVFLNIIAFSSVYVTLLFLFVFTLATISI